MPNTNNAIRTRFDFSKIPATIQIPNLIEVQKRSYDRFLQMDRLPSERDVLELRQQAVAEHLGRDAGAVGHEEHRAATHRAPLYQRAHTGVRPAGGAGMSPRSAQLSPGP